MSIGQRIKERREHLRFSKAELARRCNVSGQAVGYWEDGSSVPNKESITAIAAALDVTTSWLEYGRELERPSIPSGARSRVTVMLEQFSEEELVLLEPVLLNVLTLARRKRD